jgi:hypothetical protein
MSRHVGTKTFKVWIHIEELEDDEALEEEPEMPELVGTYSTLDEAKAAIESMLEA